MPPYNKTEWVTGGTPVVAQVLHDRIFDDHTEFPEGTTIAYEYSHYSNFVTGVRTEVARFDGKHWDITGDESQTTTVELIEGLQSVSLNRVWLLEDGATIYQRDEKEEF